MKYSYDDEFLSQIFIFFLDNNDTAFSVNVTGYPADLALFDMMLKSNGFIYKEDLKHDS